MHLYVLFTLMVSLFCIACKPQAPVETQDTGLKTESDTNHQIDYDSTQWTELTPDMGFLIDIRYATTNNFVHEVIYPCGRCFLKPIVAQKLFRMRDELLPKGYRLKMFDCYRPAPAQQKLWDKVPNPDYVAPPSEGSMHNRGVTVDITLTDVQGKELDMGTGFDFFGPEAHHEYENLSEEVLANRSLLKSTMEAAGFQAIRTEWWHYSFSGIFPPIEKWQWPCP